MEIKIVSGIAEQLCGDGGGGAPLETRYWGGTKNLSLLTLYHSKNIGRGGPGLPCSAVPEFLEQSCGEFSNLEVVCTVPRKFFTSNFSVNRIVPYIGLIIQSCLKGLPSGSVLQSIIVRARLAQLVRSLIANQEVPGSSPGLVEG